METLPFQQPNDWQFIEELKSPRIWRVNWEKPLEKLEPVIKEEFPDTEKLLDTAYHTLRAFMKEMLPSAFTVITKQTETECVESFKLDINSKQAVISAADTEGIRRGIYLLIDKWLASSTPNLTPATIQKTPWLKNRISRCFFSPTNYSDELLDDKNYYPDSYLDKLAASGINALWLSSGFEQLCSTRFTPETGKDAEKRFKKLQKIINQCRRYGIKIFLLIIEPRAWLNDSPVLEKHPSLGGAKALGRTSFCPSSSEGKEHLEECCFQIFSSVKHLGGLINITLGEGMTTCASIKYSSKEPLECPRCSKIAPHEILTQTWQAMLDGIHRADSDAKLISWLYLPFPEEGLPDWIYDLARNAPKEVTIQLNCESGAEVEQLGKTRFGGDYWLSIDKPAEIFYKFVQAASSGNVPVSAKIQVGCSHEVATVPFVPVPGLLYNKYKELYELNIDSVMQCWFFGNYPGMMNDVAGALAFEDFQTTEKEFLKQEAQKEWGKNAETVANGWQLLGDAYRNYPVSNMFQYFGPIADGISWPLYFSPANRGLAPTWLLGSEINGDNICECLLPFTLDEAIEQLEKLCSLWKQGTDIFSSLREQYSGNRARLLDICIVEALNIQFNSGLNILKFYRSRRDMQNIVNDEIDQTKRMLELTEFDSRLGFHSEAVGYKYYPAKLEWRLNELKKQFPKECYEIGIDDWVDTPNFRWKGCISKIGLELTIELQGYLPVMDEFFIGIDDSGFSFPALFHCDCQGKIYRIPDNSSCDISNSKTSWKFKLTIPQESLPPKRPLRINLIRLTDQYKTYFSWPADNQNVKGRLNMVFYNPANMGLLIGINND